jgi:hypothetical protein
LKDWEFARTRAQPGLAAPPKKEEKSAGLKAGTYKGWMNGDAGE